jgi:hypothetical protein
VDVSAGDPVRGKLSAGFFRDTGQMLDWYKRHKARGEGGGPGFPAQDSHVTVMVKNNSGAVVRAGEVLEFAGPAYTPLRSDALWVEGYTPDLTHTGWGVLLDPADGPSIRECLLIGTCLALVNITNEGHKYADRVSGSRVLQSTASGPVKILIKPTGSTPPEERACLVQLMDEVGDIVDMIEVNDTGSSAGALTYPTAEHSYAHRGIIRRYTPTGVTFENAGNCWLLLTNEWGEVAGNVPAVNHQYYGPAKYVGINDFDGESLPTYVYCRSELATEIIEVTHESVTNGDVVEATDGYHPARIRRRIADGSYADGGAVWLQFVTAFANYGAVAGEMLAVQGQYYGPARYSRTWDKVENEGEEDESHDKRPVYVCECSELSFLGEFEDNVTSGSSAGTFKIFHSRTLADSGFRKEVNTWGSNATAGKKGAIQYVAGRWVGSQTGC